MVAEKSSFCSGSRRVFIMEEAVRVVDGVRVVEGEGYLIWEGRSDGQNKTQIINKQINKQIKIKKTMV